MFAGRRGSIFHETAIPRSRGPKDEKMGVALSPSRPTVELTHDSWEDDIDYCYEHEAEADCDYKWETTSLDGAALDSPTIPHNTTSSDSKTTIKVSTTPNLVTPAATEAPLLSPLSNTSIDSPGVTTPALPRPNLTRNHSNESSFKESHGFTLSPSLLIPTDYSSQIDQDALYDELLFNDQDHQHALHAQHQFDTYRISAEGNPSSSASYRSSNWSRASASTTLSKSSSHESVVILSRAASIALQHRSISSTASGSVPELVHSSKAKRDTAELDRARNVDTQAPEVPAVPLRNKASMGLGSPTEHDRVLSPVAEMYTDSMAMPSTSLLAGAAHGRKMSVPMHTAKPSETPKSGRKRAMSAKSKGGYNLFPQIWIISDILTIALQHHSYSTISFLFKGDGIKVLEVVRTWKRPLVPTTNIQSLPTAKKFPCWSLLGREQPAARTGLNCWIGYPRQMFSRPWLSQAPMAWKRAWDKQKSISDFLSDILVEDWKHWSSWGHIS
jgi:hypothetical protein